MAKGIFVHRTDSIYDDSPAERYQFPRQYLSRVSPCIGDWIIYYEPSKVRDTRGYFAVAKVADVVPDPTAKDMYLALIEPGTYLDFVNPVPFNGPIGLVEQGVLNIGLGLAMGAKLAHPDRFCLNMMGDGAFGMSGLDIETAVRAKVAITPSDSATPGSPTDCAAIFISSRVRERRRATDSSARRLASSSISR